MKSPRHASLLVKVLGWLLLHLLILALAFFGFVGWQLGLGLDSLLSGSAGERLRVFGDAARDEMAKRSPAEWNSSLKLLGDKRGVVVGVLDFNDPASFPAEIPANILQRTKTALPPPVAGPQARRGPPPPRDRFGNNDRPPDDFEGPPPFDQRPPREGPGRNAEGDFPPSRPVFLLRGDDGDGYWAGIHLAFPGVFGQPRRHQLLLIRADGLDGSGMFFDIKPWLWGGLAVFALSLAFWTPFVLGITRYLRRLTSATEKIAAGDFRVSVPPRGNDELGSLGNAIEAMAIRLDHLISGQKRFLGDAAHELCAPLARLRTGLGILEMKMGEAGSSSLNSIEGDAQELATLVEEILAFSRAGNRAPRLQLILLEPLIREVIAREGNLLECDCRVTPGLAAVADPSLLNRALGNLVRNAGIHGGSNPKVTITALDAPGASILITVADDGPGVPVDELPRLFEPFYRPDRSRSRDTGGSGLGLAIVRTAIEACGGETSANLPATGGFAVTISLRKELPQA